MITFNESALGSYHDETNKSPSLEDIEFRPNGSVRIKNGPSWDFLPGEQKIGLLNLYKEVLKAVGSDDYEPKLRQLEETYDKYCVQAKINECIKNDDLIGLSTLRDSDPRLDQSYFCSSIEDKQEYIGSKIKEGQLEEQVKQLIEEQFNNYNSEDIEKILDEFDDDRVLVRQILYLTTIYANLEAISHLNNEIAKYDLLYRGEGNLNCALEYLGSKRSDMQPLRASDMRIWRNKLPIQRRSEKICLLLDNDALASLKGDEQLQSQIMTDDDLYMLRPNLFGSSAINMFSLANFGSEQHVESLRDLVDSLKIQGKDSYSNEEIIDFLNNKLARELEGIRPRLSRKLIVLEGSKKLAEFDNEKDAVKAILSNVNHPCYFDPNSLFSEFDKLIEEKFSDEVVASKMRCLTREYVCRSLQIYTPRRLGELMREKGDEIAERIDDINKRKGTSYTTEDCQIVLPWFSGDGDLNKSFQLIAYTFNEVTGLDLSVVHPTELRKAKHEGPLIILDDIAATGSSLALAYESIRRINVKGNNGDYRDTPIIIAPIASTSRSQVSIAYNDAYYNKLQGRREFVKIVQDPNVWFLPGEENLGFTEYLKGLDYETQEQFRTLMEHLGIGKMSLATVTYYMAPDNNARSFQRCLAGKILGEFRSPAAVKGLKVLE